MELMKLINSIPIPQSDYILVDYDLFFNEHFGIHSKFSIDNQNDLDDIKHLLDEMKNNDIAMDIFVLADSYITIDCQGNKSIYADCIWLNTRIGAEVIKSKFDGKKAIQPSSISDLVEMEEFTQEQFYLFKNSGEIVDIKDTCSECEFKNVKILYWD
jgi:hypothetical protein